MKTKKVTLSDIAIKTGVSTAAVSMILNNKKISRFSEETLKNVREVANELGYVSKSSLTPRKKLILIVCPSMFNPYYTTLVQSMEIEAYRLGVSTISFNTYWDIEREKQVVSVANQNKVDGVIFAMVPQQNKVAHKINNIIPFVVIGDKKMDLGVDTVDINNFIAGRLMGEHYINFGHSEFAYISSPLSSDHSARTERLRGLTSICKEKEIKEPTLFIKDQIIPEDELNYTETEYNVGYDLALKCLETYKSVTALVAMNDMIAYGVLDAVKSKGFSVPEDYSVSGFDNIFPSKLMGIELTTIDHHIIQRGKKATKILIAKLGYFGNPSEITRVEYGSILINRRTVSKPRE
jgi:DNA-binding LacI/PurR family transcriptional regulator